MEFDKGKWEWEKFTGILYHWVLVHAWFVWKSGRESVSEFAQMLCKDFLACVALIIVNHYWPYYLIRALVMMKHRSVIIQALAHLEGYSNNWDCPNWYLVDIQTIPLWEAAYLGELHGLCSCKRFYEANDNDSLMMMGFSYINKERTVVENTDTEVHYC